MGQSIYFLSIPYAHCAIIVHKLAGLLHNKNIKGWPAGSLIPTGFFYTGSLQLHSIKAFRIYQVLFHFLFSQKILQKACARWVVAILRTCIFY